MCNLNRMITLCIVALLACPGWTAELPAAHRERDAICQALFEAYISPRHHKVPHHVVVAATEIIVDRGRTTGFWREVVESLRQVSDGWNEIAHVRILGMMLAEDAHAREAIESGNAKYMAAAAIVALPKAVVPELISRAEYAEGAILEAYIVALCRARDARAKEFLLNILNQSKPGPSRGFHAALGLAELGDATGIEWLIAHCDSSSNVSSAWPQRVPDRRLSSSAVAALRMLSGKPTLATRTEFEMWWSTASTGWSPEKHVHLEDR